MFSFQIAVRLATTTKPSNTPEAENFNKTYQQFPSAQQYLQNKIDLEVQRRDVALAIGIKQNAPKSAAKLHLMKTLQQEKAELLKFLYDEPNPRAELQRIVTLMEAHIDYMLSPDSE